MSRLFPPIQLGKQAKSDFNLQKSAAAHEAVAITVPCIVAHEAAPHV